jgi:hypothetical protein
MGKSEHTRALLEGCHGFLHADGYAGFNGLYEPDARSGDARLVEVACWAHCRRKLFEVHAATGSAIAQEALGRMAALFKIEAEINGLEPKQRHAAHQERSLPLLADLKDYLTGAFASISRKSSLAGAIRYGLSRWPALCRPPDQPDRPVPALALGRRAPYCCRRLISAPSSLAAAVTGGRLLSRDQTKAVLKATSPARPETSRYPKDGKRSRAAPKGAPPRLGELVPD